MALEKEGFASRWSRRKQAVALEQKITNEPTNDEQIVAEIMPTEEELAKERLEKLNAQTDEDMPDLETLNEDSDFSGFMSNGVSESLRKLALQKLFHGKSYNLRDGLDEYDGDYTSFEKLDPSVITCDMQHKLEIEAKKLLAAEKEKEKAEELFVDAEINDEDSDEIAKDTDIAGLENETKTENEAMINVSDLKTNEEVALQNDNERLVRKTSRDNKGNNV